MLDSVRNPKDRFSHNMALIALLQSVFSKGIGSQLIYNSAVSTKWDMIENQARELLNNTEQGTLRYYLSEYQKGYITVDGLLLASFELLNTKAKVCVHVQLMSHIIKIPNSVA